MLRVYGLFGSARGNKMSISAISSSATSGYQPSQQDDVRQAFLQLVNAIKSGDLTSAQQAYSAFTQAQSASGKQPDPNSPFAQALSQIGNAVQSGSISDAQQALSSLQAQGRGGHHHHHHRAGSDSTGGGATAQTMTQSTTQSTNTIDITA